MNKNILGNLVRNQVDNKKWFNPNICGTLHDFIYCKMISNSKFWTQGFIWNRLYNKVVDKV